MLSKLLPYCRYEEAVSSLMIDWAEHPGQPLKELEVFVGFILNKTGSQTNRQRDKSVKLKDEFERIATLFMRQLRRPESSDGLAGEQDGLELCLAAVHVGCAEKYGLERGWSRRGAFKVESFKILAASALVGELNSLQNRMIEITAGGFVGVRGASPPHNSIIPRQEASSYSANNAARQVAAQYIANNAAQGGLASTDKVTKDLLALIQDKYAQAMR